MSRVAQATGAPDEAFYKEVGQLLSFGSDFGRSVVADPASSGVGSVLEFSRTEELRLVTPGGLLLGMNAARGEGWRVLGGMLKCLFLHPEKLNSKLNPRAVTPGHCRAVYSDDEDPDEPEAEEPELSDPHSTAISFELLLEAGFLLLDD